ncbi:tRNA (adenosine(37)-N6)-threonylcarbamoyltransferase complex dimerization subunit type 1 TsaB [Zeaxanthinibacter sp. PT1]|uniref:tRNA (adenosine(37)-N6)-threonylcarbamoyltransferase complex dimerization subunit type 1 TsaB n=1 Tax=Zeaxanthinibacter TaxID=561554 RepID=UPI00234A7AC8|nr:tRNA (adenosine(37)-N6)-threonylcarbamoyltransferase complex dimerization subunit type 1 TsaB [Zeaxanthinibacter sp. PT1]MDC6350140.1 tRNA (adenosine(37)-N6)-threonylcarbamoyltransferase complex dimerization subunit type 1 TsaB [Zeaxanthinibacter sp. PT1]
MALILNLETATTNCSVSLAEDGNLLSLKEENSAGYSHAEQLHYFIEEVIKTAGKKLSDLDAVAVSKGPGSYTGLRIGVSAAKGLCFALDIPLLAIATLDSLARQVRVESGLIIPMLDARRMEVYSKVLDHNYVEIRETKAEVLNENSYTEYVNKGKVYLPGSGAQKCKELFNDANFEYRDSLVPSAREMTGLSYERYEKGLFEDLAYFEPYYLKDFILQGKKSKSK